MLPEGRVLHKKSEVTSSIHDQTLKMNLILFLIISIDDSNLNAAQFEVSNTQPFFLLCPSQRSLQSLITIMLKFPHNKHTDCSCLVKEKQHQERGRKKTTLGTLMLNSKSSALL